MRDKFLPFWAKVFSAIGRFFAKTFFPFCRDKLFPALGWFFTTIWKGIVFFFAKILFPIISPIYQRALLTLKEFFSQRTISLIVFISILVTVFCVGVFSVLGENFNRYITDKFASSIPPNSIKVSPLESSGMAGVSLRNKRGAKLTDSHLAKIRRMEGVTETYPFMSVRAPMQLLLRLSTFIPLLPSSYAYYTDMVGIGAPYPMISKDIRGVKGRTAWNNWSPGKEVPVLVPTLLLDMYNNSFAMANNLPKFTEELLVGKQAEVLFGRSSFRTIPGFMNEKATLVGFTDKVPSLALVLPISVVKYYNQKFGKPEASREYVYMFVEVSSHQSLLKVSQAIKDMGFIVETEKTVSKQIMELQENVNLVLKVLMFVIIILALFAISFSTLIATFNRLDYYRILRILGASKTFITFTVLLKYGTLGFIAAFLGSYPIIWFFQNVAPNIAIPGFSFTMKISPQFIRDYLIYGTLIPLASTIPAIVKIYAQTLNSD